MSLLPFAFTVADWRVAVRASAYAVLNAREDKLAKAKRLAVDVCVRGPEATAFRAAGPPALLAFLDRMRNLVCGSDEAMACFDAALAASQDEWASQPDGECCFSRADQELRQVTLYGNQGPGRTQSTHTVQSPGWSTFVQALMVVGRVHTWLDELLEGTLTEVGALDASQRTISDEALLELADVTLQTQRRTFNYAARFLCTSAR